DHRHAVLVERGGVFAVVAPVAIGAFVDDAPLLEQALEHEPHLDALLLRLHVVDAEGEVFVVDEYGDERFVSHGPRRTGGWGVPQLPRTRAASSDRLDRLQHLGYEARAR